MRLAIALAEQNVNQNRGGPFGAVVVRDGEILAQSTNSVVLKNDPTAHAEISAIRAACAQLNRFDLSGCHLYTSCEPCPMCLGAIYWARIESVFYANTKADAAQIGFDDHFIYEEFALAPQERKLPVVQLLRLEALKAFKLWEDSKDKISY